MINGAKMIQLQIERIFDELFRRRWEEIFISKTELVEAKLVVESMQ